MFLFPFSSFFSIQYSFLFHCVSILSNPPFFLFFSRSIIFFYSFCFYTVIFFPLPLQSQYTFYFILFDLYNILSLSPLFFSLSPFQYNFFILLSFYNYLLHSTSILSYPQRFLCFSNPVHLFFFLLCFYAFFFFFFFSSDPLQIQCICFSFSLFLFLISSNLSHLASPPFICLISSHVHGQIRYRGIHLPFPSSSIPMASYSFNFLYSSLPRHCAQLPLVFRDILL